MNNMSQRLFVDFMGKKLCSPIIVGAGPSTKSCSDIIEAAKFGAGAAIIKSIGWHADVEKTLKDRKRYRWIKGYGTYLKSTYLCEILSKPYGCNLIKEVKSSSDIPIYASVFYPALSNEHDIDRWIDLVSEVSNAGCDGVQLDFFYLDLRKLNDDEVCFFVDAINRICRSTHLPVMPKLNIAMDDDLIENLLKNSLSDAYVFIDSINTEPYIDIWNKGAPLFDGQLYNSQTNRSGSVVAGEALLPFTFNMTQRLYRSTDKNLSAGGGLEHWEDIIRCIMLGASTVHLTSILMRRGFKYIRDLNSSINNYLDKQHVEKISDIRGVSYSTNAGNTIIQQKPILDMRAIIDSSKCNDCGVCERFKVCDSFSVKPYDFINNCDGCTYCLALCPRNAISLIGV
ncbi:Dihydropyrimidine dehydrogenase [Yersinia intermedia ATCC 29909]|jgi:dihydroorotate dehydrogenase/NAD-dependent dihydropyrimidine dehydrogenase PreA subunit|nr:Dihydropyrimidine dehydrogenase [Yersinia intermedia ATCC 29909]